MLPMSGRPGGVGIGVVMTRSEVDEDSPTAGDERKCTAEDEDVIYLK